MEVTRKVILNSLLSDYELEIINDIKIKFLSIGTLLSMENIWKLNFRSPIYKGNHVSLNWVRVKVCVSKKENRNIQISMLGKCNWSSLEMKNDKRELIQIQVLKYVASYWNIHSVHIWIMPRAFPGQQDIGKVLKKTLLLQVFTYYLCHCLIVLACRYVFQSNWAIH